MDNKFNQIQDLLRKKTEIQSRLNLLLYDGRPEIKERDDKYYIYIRKRELGKQTSKYVDVYSDVLFQTLHRQWLERKQLNKQLREIKKNLAELGYSPTNLTPLVMKNIEFARVNMKANIYDQAILEGVATTFSDTETIIENGKISGMRAEDVQKILNLKHAWEFILDDDVIQSKSDYYLLCYIAQLVNEGFYMQGGKIRAVPVKIGSSSYIPPIPIESDVKEKIDEIITAQEDAIDVAINICLYCMKTQIFNDGNKRASVIFANHFLISKGGGLLVIPENYVSEFKKMLVNYYENDKLDEIKAFMKSKCWKKF